MSASKVKMTSSLEFSRMAWGMGSLPMSFSYEQVIRMLDTCEEVGITTIDNAENYGGYTREALLGYALSKSPMRRERLVLVTKCGCVGDSLDFPEYYMYHYDTRKEHIIAAAENSLKNFKTDRIDVLLLHRPDPLMDADEVAEAFYILRKSGKVLNFGVSNFNPRQFQLLSSRVDQPLITNEIQCSVLYTDPIFDGTLDICQQYRIAPMAWGPLGRGELFTGTNEKVKRVIKELNKVGDELGGVEMEKLALSWLLMHPSKIIPILGTGSPGEMKGVVACEKIKMSRQQWYRILIAATGEGLP